MRSSGPNMRLCIPPKDRSPTTSLGFRPQSITFSRYTRIIQFAAVSTTEASSTSNKAWSASSSVPQIGSG